MITVPRIVSFLKFRAFASCKFHLKIPVALNFFPLFALKVYKILLVRDVACKSLRRKGTFSAHFFDKPTIRPNGPGQIGSDDYFRVADNAGVITRWLESKCRAPLLHSYQISTS